MTRSRFAGRPPFTEQLRAVGNVADLVLLRDNPLANIANTRQIERVMIGTNWLSKAYIDQALSRLSRR